MEFLDDFNPTFDIVFMDIEMPYINGIETAKRLRGIDRSVCLLFVTNMFQFAVKGYEVDAMDFVVKPIDYFSFKEKIGKAVRHCVRKTARHIVLKLKSGFKKFKTDDIFYVESIGHTLRYLTAEGPFELRGTMQDAENMLKGCGFSRCSNSFLVNLKHIKEMTGNSIKICDTEIAVGRTKKRSFMNDLTDYLGGMI